MKKTIEPREDGTIITKYLKPFEPNRIEDAELIFKVNLKNRKYTIMSDSNNEISIDFFDEDNCFGWTERIPIQEFTKRLTENNMYLKLK